MRLWDATVPAPADLGIAVAAVPVGSDVQLRLRLESVVDGVLVSGSARVRVVGECSRCLDPVSWDEEVDLLQLFVYPDGVAAAAGETAGDEDDDVSLIETDFIDLEPILRDAVVLALPLAPVCREDCPGLCVRCGARLADDPGHQHDDVDPRWAALAAALERDAGVRPGDELHDELTDSEHNDSEHNDEEED
ncbi:MAG: DUF177 domain-containing protein [Actinomycetota bacterium]|nr:MAG: DUF177 domain-containing protein [Actinomycetota bacterium]